jgi:hypothetical protein
MIDEKKVAEGYLTGKEYSVRQGALRGPRKQASKSGMSVHNSNLRVQPLPVVLQNT